MSDEERKQSEPMTLEDAIREGAEQIMRRARVVEAHRVTCDKRVCSMCGRHECPICHKPSDAPDALCGECNLNEALRAARVVPERFRWARDADRDTLIKIAGLVPETIDRALVFARRGETSALVLVGDAGVGKTSLAVAMYAAWLAVHRKPSARFVVAYELARARSGYPLGKGEAPAVDAAMRAELLVLDGIGDARDDDVVTDVLFARHNAERLTWATTGMSREQIATRYGAGVARRIFEGATVVRIGGHAARGGA